MDSLRKKETWLGVILAVIFEQCLQALLKLIWPYVGASFNKVAAVLSFGSEWVRDAPYRAAALDPAPLSSLSLMFVVTTGASIGFGVLLAKTVHGILPMRLVLAKALPTDERLRIVRQRKIRFFLRVVILTFALLIFQTLVVGSSMLNSAVLTRRVFEADLKILAPHISPAECAALEAQFALMESKKDFSNVLHRMELLAVAKGAVLRPELHSTD